MEGSMWLRDGTSRRYYDGSFLDLVVVSTGFCNLVLSFKHTGRIYKQGSNVPVWRTASSFLNHRALWGILVSQIMWRILMSQIMWGPCVENNVRYTSVANNVRYTSFANNVRCISVANNVRYTSVANNVKYTSVANNHIQFEAPLFWHHHE
jgi:hypothetical protein